MLETTPKQILIAMQSEAWSKITGVSTPGDLAWEVHEVVEVLLKTVEFYDKRRVALLEKYGQRGEDGFTFLDEESEQAFHDHHQKVLDFPVRLHVDRLGTEHAEAAGLTVAEILSFKWLFAVPEIEMDDPFADMT